MAKMGLALERGAHFQKACFYSFSEQSRCPSCSAFPWGLLGLSGHPLGRFRGPNNQTKDTATLRPAVHRVLRLRTGGQGSTRRRNTTDRRAESLRRDRCVFKTLVKYEGLEPFWHTRGPKHEENVCLCVLLVPRRLQKGFPEGHERKTLVNSDQIWGVFVLSFSCPLRFLLRGSGFLFGAVLAAPSVPQGCLGCSFGVPLRTARGAQKGPPYRRDSLFLGSLWGPLGCSVGSCMLSSVSFGPFP